MQPEQRLSTRPVFQGRVVRVRVDNVRLPDGRETSREVVEHSASVVVVPVDAGGNVLLVRQYRYPVGEELLEAPAGGVEEGESPDACAQRELQEETGYKSGDLRPLGGFWISPGFCTEFMHAYLARDLAPSRLQADYDENIQTERVPLSDAMALVRRGEIRDAKTIAALLMAASILEKA